MGTIFAGAGVVLGWFGKHFQNGANGHGSGGKRDEIRWQEEMRSLTTGISEAVCEGNKELTEALRGVVHSLDRMGELLGDVQRRTQRIENVLNDLPAVRAERRGNTG